MDTPTKTRVAEFMINKGLYTSFNAEWETPKNLFDDMVNEYGYCDLDVSASSSNSKCRNYFTIDDDCLRQKWYGKCFMNPPYGRKIGSFIKKAYEETFINKNCHSVLMLLPDRTDTKWFHDYCVLVGEIKFIKGRIKFVGAKHNAPFPSMIVFFESY